MMNSRLTAWLALTALVATGCLGKSSTATGTTTQEVVAPNADTFVTDVAGISRFRGYNEVYDMTYDSCLTRCSDVDNAPEVDSDESSLKVSFVSNAADITQSQLFTLDAQVEMALHIGNISANASMKLANSSSFSRKAVRMLLVAHRKFKVTHNEQVELKPQLGKLLIKTPGMKDADYDKQLIEFMGVCGHVYAKSTLHGAYLFALYEFTSTDQSKLSKLEGKLGLAFKSHFKAASAGVEMSAQNELNQALSDVQWKVDVIAKGFKVNGVSGEAPGKVALQQDGRGGLDLQRIVQFFEAMQDSVGADMTAIQQANDQHAKSVFTLGLTAGDYAARLLDKGFPDAKPSDVTAARTRMSEILTAHEIMLQTYGALATGVASGRDEVKRFLELGEGQEEMQIMKWPGKPYQPAFSLRDEGRGLVDRVEPYDKKLDPRAGAGPATELARRISACWMAGRNGSLATCLPDVSKPAEAATGNTAFVNALKALKDYNDTARPVHLNCGFVNAPTLYTRLGAVAPCGGNSLPTWDEAKSMGLIIYHRAPRNYNGKRSFWLKEVDCKPGFPFTFVEGDDDDLHTWCSQIGRTEPAICIPPNGLFPVSVPKLYPPGEF